MYEKYSDILNTFCRVQKENSKNPLDIDCNSKKSAAKEQYDSDFHRKRKCEYFFETNLFGWGAKDQIYGDRVTSFFKDEPIVGAYLVGFIFLVFGHLLKRNNKKTFAFIFLIIAFMSVIFTGERSNTIKLFSGIIIYFLLLDFLKIKIKIFIILLFISIFGVILSQSEYLNIRYNTSTAIVLFKDIHFLVILT